MKILVLGVGNSFRGDDGAGLAVAEKLKADIRLEGLTEIVAINSDAAQIISLLENYDLVFAVDAMTGLEAGTVREVDPGAEMELQFSGISGHGFGLARAIELGRALEQLPAELQVIGIAAADFQEGAGLSENTKIACDLAAQKIAADILSIKERANA